MTSDRMMQVIGRIERAVTRLESTAQKAAARGAAQAGEIARLRTAATEAEADHAAAPAMDPAAREKAVAALRSLDGLIDELRSGRADG